MFKLKNLFGTTKSDGIPVSAPIGGILKPLEGCSDPMFAQGVMGPGFVIEPHADKESELLSPIDGTLSMVFETLHAYGITSDSGIEVLLHAGVDTVELKGAPFDAKAIQGAPVERGDALADMDVPAIRDAGKSAEVIVVFPSLENRTFSLDRIGEIKAGEVVGGIA